jgi:GTP-binding protein YchF
MSLKAGIVGLPNVGKSTLFNAITKQNILAANYPFATIEPNVGVVVVPDDRLNRLDEIYKTKKAIPTTYEFTDIAGLVKGASQGEGLGNKFLSHIREVDAIVEVVRCFEDNNIVHVENKVDPISDIETIELELTLADLDVISGRLERVEKKAKASKDKDALKEIELLKKVKESLEKGISVRNLDLNDEEKEMLKPFSLLTMKPMIYMANISDKDIHEGTNKYVEMVKEYAKKEDSKVVVVSAKIEMELAELSLEEKEMFKEELGIKDSGLEQLIKATYDLLGLATYFTAGVEECRAWTFKKGMKAPECAGIIHSDFERGFIRAEVISYEDIDKLGNEKLVKEAGKMRLEGKDYIMQDGDICHFRFNV